MPTLPPSGFSRRGDFAIAAALKLAYTFHHLTVGLRDILFIIAYDNHSEDSETL